MSIAWIEILGIWLGSLVAFIAIGAGAQAAAKRRIEERFDQEQQKREALRDEMHKLSEECVRQENLSALKVDMKDMVQEVKNNQGGLVRDINKLDKQVDTMAKDMQVMTKDMHKMHVELLAAINGQKKSK